MISEMIGDRFEVIKLLGEGAAGQVWHARDIELDREVALKALRAEIRADKETLERFQKEKRNLAKCHHRNITALWDFYKDQSTQMMVMEFVPGATLEEILRARGRLHVKDALAVLLEASSGLGYAHQRGLYHRDIKPSNLMISDEGLLKITDFGIARVRGSQRLTQHGQAVGTPLYFSPEVCRGGEGGELSDQYSLAVVIYELLCGRPPFEADNDFDLMRAHLEASPARLHGRVSGISRLLEQAILKALSKVPEQRFASMQEFAMAAGAGAVAGEAEVIFKELLKAGPEQIYAPPSQDNDTVVHHVSRRPGFDWRGTQTAVLDQLRRPLVLAIGAGAVLAGAGVAAYSLFFAGDPTLQNLPAPPNMADIHGPITSVIAGNSVAVNGATINLAGIVDNAQSGDEVVAEQQQLQKVLPHDTICYKKPEDFYQCFEADRPHRDLARIAIDQGVAKPSADDSGQPYLEYYQNRAGR